MDTQVIAYIGRVLERLLIVAISGLSLVMGWNLYVRGVETKKSVNILY